MDSEVPSGGRKAPPGRQKRWHGGWGRRLAAGMLAPSAIVPSVARAAGEDTLSLRLSGKPLGLFDPFHTAFPLTLLLMVVALYAVAITLFHVRNRDLWNHHFEELNRALREVQARVERCGIFLAADRQVLVAWGGASGEPEFEGDPGILVETSRPERVLAYSEWLPEDEARQLERMVHLLRSDGTAFSRQFLNRAGEHVEVDGRPVAGRAVLAIRLATGARLQLARIKDERDALDAARAQLQNVIEAIPQPVWLRDRAGRLDQVNSAYALAVDAPDRIDAVSRQAEFLDSDDRARIQSRQAAEGRFRGEVMAVVAGQRRKFEVVEVAGPGGGGGFALDKTELEAARMALERQMEAHVRTLDELPSAVVMFDEKQVLTYANRAFRRLFGIDESYLRRRPSNSELIDHLRASGRLPEATDFRAWKAELLAHYSSTETSEQGWRLPNGRVLRVVLSPNPQGGITYLFEDETERFTLESSVEELKNTQGETLTALSEGVAVFGSDGLLHLANPAFARLWGLAPDALADRPHVEALGQALDEAMRPEWRQIAGLVCGVADARVDHTFRLKNASGRALEATTTPLPDGATLVAVSDITDSVEAERRLTEHNEALRQAARLRTEFIKSISFELRSPLTNVVGLAGALAEGVAGPLSPKQQAYAADLARSSDAVLALTNDILELASLESGGRTATRVEVDLPRVIEEATEGLKDRLGEAKVRLALNVAAGLHTLRTDPSLFRSILFNLLANAVAYSEPGDAVRLAVRRGEGGATIEVMDAGRGVGLPGDSATGVPHVEREHGLRFSLAKALIALLDGRIELDETAEGQSLVRVTLPDA